MKILPPSRSTPLSLALVGTSCRAFGYFGGCVYYPTGSEVFAGPPPFIGPSLNVRLYGSPAGYYYQQLSCFYLPQTGRYIITAEAAIIFIRDAITGVAATDTTTDSPKSLTLETMNLFDAVLASLNDPSRATQMSDLERSHRRSAAAALPQIKSPASSAAFLKPMLREQQAVAGPEGVDSLLQELKQNADSPDQLRQVLGSERMDQMVGRAEQKTGLDARVLSCASCPLSFRRSSDSFSPAVPLPRRLPRGTPREASFPLALAPQARRPVLKLIPSFPNFLTPMETETWIWRIVVRSDLCLFAQVIADSGIRPRRGESCRTCNALLQRRRPSL